MKIYISIIMVAFVAIKSVAQIETPQICPFTEIHRIVICNDSIASFYKLDSLKLAEMKNYWFKSTIDSIESHFYNCTQNTLNKRLYLVYVFFKKGNTFLQIFTNTPLIYIDAIFTWNNILYNGKMEDKTFGIDFWQANINNTEIKTVPYKVH